MYVLYHHTLRSGFDGPLPTLIAHGYLAVDIFFTLSGFVMAMNYSHMFAAGNSYASFVRFLGRRIARVYPLYLVATLVGVILALRHHPYLPALALPIIANVALVQEWGLFDSFDPPAWSISAEWAAYLLFPGILAVTAFATNRTRVITGIASAAILIAMSFLPASLHGHGRPDALFDIVSPGWAIPVARCVAEFALGVLAYGLTASHWGLLLSPNPYFAPGLCIITAALLIIPKTDVWIVLLTPFVLVGLSSTANLASKILSLRLFEFLGRISYSLYLFHLLIGGAVHHLAGGIDTRLHHAADEAVIAVVAIALNLPIAYAGYRLIELPARRWLRSALEPSDNPAAKATSNPVKA